jgi:GNAT superfamily N-acetyltransferase
MTIEEDLEGKERQRVTAIARVLIDDGLLAEVTPAEDDHWLGYELASLIELRRGEIVAPSALPDPRRDPWLPRVSYDADLGAMRASMYAPFWLLDDCRRVGIVVLGASGGPPKLDLSSLFVLPEHRGRGVAKRLLERLIVGVQAAGLRDLRLDADWCASRAVRFYLDLGMWVRMWKRGLQLAWIPDMPRWSVVVEGDVARFVVGDRDVIVARRMGDRLKWRAAPKVDFDLLVHAEMTFSVALALHGFPLITTDEAWAEQVKEGYSDGGDSVALAFEIQGWEACARERGWRVDAPRVPGVPTAEEVAEAKLVKKVLAKRKR